MKHIHYACTSLPEINRRGILFLVSIILIFIPVVLLSMFLSIVHIRNLSLAKKLLQLNVKEQSQQNKQDKLIEWKSYYDSD